MRGLKWLALSLALLLAVGAVSAQANWSAYLFNSVTRELVRVGLDGTQTAIPLNLPEGAFLVSEAQFHGVCSPYAFVLADMPAKVPPSAASFSISAVGFRFASPVAAA